MTALEEEGREILLAEKEALGQHKAKAFVGKKGGEAREGQRGVAVRLLKQICSNAP